MTTNKCVRPNCAHTQLSRGLCGRHYKKAHHAGLIKVPTELVDATGTRRRVHDLMLRGHTSQAIADRVGISRMEVGRIFDGRRLRVRRDLAGNVSRVHAEMEVEPGTSVRTANWARRRGWTPLDRYVDPDDPNSPLANRSNVMREEIEHLLGFGWDADAISRHLGCHPSYVRQIRNERREVACGA